MEHQNQRVPFTSDEVFRSSICRDSDNIKRDSTQYCFEEDISSVLQVASQNHTRRSDWIKEDEDDGNEKKRKTFNLRQRLMITFQPFLARFNSTQFQFNVKDIIIIILLVGLTFAIALLCSRSRHDYDSELIERNLRILRGDKNSEEALVQIPQPYELSFADVIDTKIRDTDTPVFFHVPRSAGITLQDVLSHCWNLVEASQVGTTHGHDKELELKVWRHEDGGRYVNVDTTTLEGIKRAKRLKLSQSGLADVIYSTYLYQISDLFASKYRARVFTLIRNPISRAVSMYFYLQEAVARGEKPSELFYKTIEEYAQSPHMENNLLTRLLINRMEGPLNPEHLIQAKEILRRKFLIGLTSNLEESLERFKFYFGWQKASALGAPSDEERSRIHECEERLINSGDNTLSHPNIEKGTHAWKLLVAQNIYDIQLYEYAQMLFQEQGLQLFLFSKAVGRR
jgi:hypothetical protein